MRYPKLIDKLHVALPPAGRHLLSRLQALSEELDQPLYLVGGPVRDLLLGRAPLDLDICVEGDAISLARHLAEQTGARLRVHPTFLSAAVHLDGFVLDVATTRSETYARPGALPTVKPASVREDLLRRDFSINAIALSLSGSNAGELIDPTGGHPDLDAGLVRALHERSFQDDATRIIRAFRYASRLGFALELQTHSWLKRDLPHIDTISAARLRNELSRVLMEPEPERIFLSLRKLGVLHAIHPAISFGERRARAFEALRLLASEIVPTGGWTLLSWNFSDGEVSSLSRRLAMTRAQDALLAAAPRLRAIEEQLAAAPPPRSGLVTLLSPYPVAAIWALAAIASQSVKEQCLDYLQRARQVRPLLGGDDVIALGIPRGPQVAETLLRLRNAKLNGEVKSRTDEERFVQRTLAGALSSSSVHLPSSRP
jgi:tRNA nucleotidyltransferase (CCA-adding enzyme)